MSATLIEGALREVALADVLQLLDLGRKSGVVHVSDGLGREARVRVVAGRVADAALDGGPRHVDDRGVREVVIELLGWTSGRFAVAPLDAAGELAPGASLAVDSVLMEAARRADEWARLADRVPGACAVPHLTADGGAATVVLSPEEWEVIAYADGEADLRAIAGRTGRELLAVAGVVHRLVGAGLLAVARDAAAAVPRAGDRSSES